MTQRQSGFTLIEALIAVTLVGLVSGLAVANFGSALGRARFDAARDVLVSLYVAEQVYGTNNDDGNAATPLPYWPALSAGASGTCTDPGAGAQGGGCLGPCAVGAGGNACRTAWRTIAVDDPNATAQGTTFVLRSLDRTPGPGATPGFDIRATDTGSGNILMIDERGVLCPGAPTVACTWTRP